MSVGWSNTASECRDQKLNKKSIVSKKSIDLEFFLNSMHISTQVTITSALA